MDLWVRSQDKLTMLKVNDIKIIDYRGLKEQIEKSPVLSFLGNMEQMKDYIDKDGWGLNCNEMCLGIYATKERALEVLDEIQEYLINLDKAVIYSMTPVEDYLNVYEMPKE